MGTRGLNGVVIDGAIKAAYNQFDTYPSGLGVVMLADAQKLAALEEDELRRVIQAWREVELVSEGDEPTAEQIAKLLERGFEAQQVSTGQDWYSWLRDAQGSLDAYLKAGFMLDSKSFGYDSLFCEWGYLIDLDQRTLEVYEGFQKQAHSEGRWSDRGAEQDNGYYPIKLVAKWTFGELPDEATFLAKLEPEQEED